MKKLIITLAIFTSLMGSVFAERNFANRFFEFKVNVPVALSNNLIALEDVFTEEVVIDLPKIADEMTEMGAVINANAAPSLSINLDIPNGLILGLNIGAQADVGIGISKDLFTLIGKGNVGMDSVTTKMNNTYTDVFAFTSLNGGWNGKKLRMNFTGTTFWAIAHLDASDTYVKIYNNEENNSLGVEAQFDAKLYSTVNVSEDMNDFQKLFNQTKSNLGFDMGADIQYDLLRILSVGGQARIPLVPSRLSMLTQYSADKYSFKKEINIGEMVTGSKSDDKDSETPASTREEEEEEETEEKDDSPNITMLSSPYIIHRPLKIGVTADFHPFGTLLSTKGYLGLGVRHPFAKDQSETQAYIDYSVSGRLSLWNILSFELSHSRMDEIFKNELAVALNIRLVEVDAGVSFQSADFAKSFTGAGVGAFVTVCVGF